MRDIDEIKLSRRSVQRRKGGGHASNGTEPEVIKVLEDALDQARRAEIIAAAIVFQRPDEDKCSGVSAPPRMGRRYLAAAADYLKRDIIAETDNRRA